MSTKIIAIDTETTGLVHGWNEITEVGMVLLDNNFNIIPNETFNCLIKINHPERYPLELQKKIGITCEMLEKDGLHIIEVRSNMLKWFERIGVTSKTKLLPLGQFYDGFDRLFIKDILNCDCTPYEDCYDFYFERTSIDLKHAARTYNSVIDTQFKHLNKTKFNAFSLKNICWYFGIEYIEKEQHRAMIDIYKTIECYRRTLGLFQNLRGA